MFTTLLECRAPRSRQLGSTIASLLAHGLIGAAVVGLTLAGRADARVAPPSVDQPAPVFVPVGRQTPPTMAPRRGSGVSSTLPAPPRMPALLYVPSVVAPPIPEFAQPFPAPDTLGMLARRGVGLGGSMAGGQGDAGIVNELETDRAPQLRAGASQPHYPDALRAAGITGRVVVQFVVDTLGRAEPGMNVIEGDRAEFVDAVRVALPRFHFTPGEAAGRKVRTRVQVPFDFTLR